jgi:two-component system alkaline phosphatase synthesis response regulator PhoP
MINQKKKILLIDDDPDLLEGYKILLESKGYEVVAAEDSIKGFKIFQQSKPDAAVIDLIMEEHDSGFILCHKIKEDSHGKNIPVLLLTSATYITGFKFGSSTPEEKEWIKCDEILNKPILIDDLIMKLESYFSTKEVKHQD